MTKTEIIIECAKLDGFEDILGSLTAYIAGGDATFLRLSNLGCEPIWSEEREGLICCSVPNYTTSRDAIVPVIEKVWREKLDGKEETLESESFLVSFGEHCGLLCRDDLHFSITPIYRFVLLKPLQLCKALLRATGKWKD